MIHSLTPDTDTSRKHIALPASNGLLYMHTSELIYAKSEGHLCILFMTHGRYTVGMLLKDLMIKIDSDRLYRCHKSYLINLDHVRMITRGIAPKVILSSSSETPISRSKRAELISILSERYNEIEL